MKKAEAVMPGGVTANIKSFAPYPLVMKKGSGPYLTDVDDNGYVDYLLSYGALKLGHGHPEVKEAIHDNIEENGTWLFGTPHQLEVDFGKVIKQYYPSMELLRYTNSGTEATLLALRLAEAHTGKHKIAKFEGHYHGGHNQVLYSINPQMDEAGDAAHPNAVPDSKELTGISQKETIMLPFNDLSHTEEILRHHQDDIAALILEPLQGGFIPATQAFMDGIRHITHELGIVLIFDEVKTGFRVNMGGAQEIYGVKPDLTTLGKVVGGGFPIGIVGGHTKIMMTSAPSNGNKPADVLFHSGTYNGHPMILAAGMATVQVLEREISSVHKLTGSLRNNLERLFAQKGIAMKTLGMGSVFNIVLTGDEVHSHRDYLRADFNLRRQIDMALLDEGIYTKPVNRYSLSTSHSEKEIDKTIEAYTKVLDRI